LRPEQLGIVALRAGSGRESVRQPAPLGALEIGEATQQAGLDLMLDQLLTSTGWLTIRSFASSVTTHRRLGAAHCPIRNQKRDTQLTPESIAGSDSPDGCR
jgi:hypothetical protein